MTSKKHSRALNGSNVIHKGESIAHANANVITEYQFPGDTSLCPSFFDRRPLTARAFILGDDISISGFAKRNRFSR